MGVRALLFAASATSSAQGLRQVSHHHAAGQAQSDCYSKYDKSPLLRLSPCSFAEAQALAFNTAALRCQVLEKEELFPPPSGGGCGSTLAICGPSGAAVLRERHGDLVELLQADSGAYYRDLSGFPEDFNEEVALRGSLVQTDGPPAFYSKWRNLEAKQSRIERLVNGSGGLAKLETFGKTVQGRPLRLVRFTGEGYASGMPKVVLTYQVHAREWIAGMAGVYAVEKFVEKAKAEPKFLQGMEVVLVPLSNPDGYVYSTTKDRYHRKNMRLTKVMKAQMAASLEQQGSGSEPEQFACDVGVDINRNAPTGWEKVGSDEDQCGEVFGGEHAMSEPETQAIAKLFKEAPMSVHVDIHSYGQLVLSGWAYTKEVNPRKAEFDVLGKSIQAAIKSTHNRTYKFGTTPELLYIATGVLPDYSTSLGALGLTIELRPSGEEKGDFAPPPSAIAPAAEEAFAGVLAAIKHARTMKKHA